MNQKKLAFRTILPVLGACLLIWWVAPPARTSDEPVLDRAVGEGRLAPLEAHAPTCRAILSELRRSYYRKVRVDDAFSEKVFDAYLSALDPSRRLFMKSDIDEFEQYRDRIDDQALLGDLGPAFDMYNRFIERATERFEYLLFILSSTTKT